MPTFGDDVHVEISDALIITVLNTPGGAMYRWRDVTAERIKERARKDSPVNRKDNARHRGGAVGRYKRSWHWDRFGSEGHHLRAIVFNTAPYASYVEYDSGERNGLQRFSWAGWYGGRSKGEIGYVTRTGARAGKHILRDATNKIMPTRCDGYTGLR